MAADLTPERRAMLRARCANVRPLPCCDLADRGHRGGCPRTPRLVAQAPAWVDEVLALLDLADEADALRASCDPMNGNRPQWCGECRAPLVAVRPGHAECPPCRERDALRAEVEHWKRATGYDDPEMLDMYLSREGVDTAFERLGRLWHEARAEVERLRAMLPNDETPDP